jgi:hypothetical protein
MEKKKRETEEKVKREFGRFFGKGLRRTGEKRTLQGKG